MTFQGMDPGVIRDIAARLDAQAERLGGVLTSLQATVSRARNAWQGPDQGSFDSAWSANHRPALAAAHGSVAELAASLRTEAGQQDATSSDLAGTPGGGAPVAGIPQPPVVAPPPPPPPPVPDPLQNPEVIAALAGFQPGRPATPQQLDALTRALNDLPPDQRQLLVDDLIKQGLLPQIKAAMAIDSLGVFNGALSNVDRLSLYSALLSAASPAAIATLTATLPINPSLDISGWTKNGTPIYSPLTTSLLGPNGAQPNDISQGGIGDCYFLSSLIATAQADPGFVPSHIHDNGNGTTTVTLYDNGEPVPVTVTNSVPTENGNTLGVNSPDNDWAKIYEKAYAQYRGGYGTINQGGWGRDGLGAITGQPVTTVNQQTGWTNDIPFVGTSPKAPNVPVSQIATLLNTHHAVLIGTTSSSGNTDDSIDSDIRHDAPIENHEYVVQSVNSNGTVTLRNPWDPNDRPTYSWSDVEKWSSEVVYTNTTP